MTVMMDRALARGEPADVQWGGHTVAELEVAWLVRQAAGGDKQAWERLVDQYARLIWSITKEFKLVESDAADVVQTTWMRLIEHIGRLQHPERVGSWLAATARNECRRSLASRKRIVLVHEDVAFDGPVGHEPEIDEALLAEERAEVVRAAMTHLPRRWQRLITLLMEDPPASYAEISDELGLPIGSIGPTRARCLARLRVLLQRPEEELACAKLSASEGDSMLFRGVAG